MSIKKVSLKPHWLEDLLNENFPDWKKGPLYKWQWDPIERKALDHETVLDLEGFEKVTVGSCMLYSKGNSFVLLKKIGDYTTVLTNIEPTTNDPMVYNPDSKELERTIDKLF
jgi:hypothetical protein